MKILEVYEHHRTLDGQKIKAVRITLSGAIAASEIDSLKTDYGCSEEIEHTLVLSNPIVDKDEKIMNLMAERDELANQINLLVSKGKV